MTVSIRLAERADAARLNAALTRLSADLGDTHQATDAALEAAGWGATRPFTRNWPRWRGPSSGW